MSKENREKASTILFEDACGLMEAGDYTTAAVCLRLSVLLGNHDAALRNLYDQAQEEERVILRWLKSTFYRALLSLFNPNRLFWVRDSHNNWQMIWANSADIRCPHCGELNTQIDLLATGGWLECIACERQIQVIKDGAIQCVPLIRPREER